MEEITPESVMEQLNRDESFELIDVRENEEWKQVQIPGTDHLSMEITERGIEKPGIWAVK